jgi:signal transduction histidine kinase
VRTIWANTIAGIRPWNWGEAAAELLVASIVLRAGIQRERRLLVAVGAVIVVAATATVLRAAHPGGVSLDLSALCLLAGAVVLVVTVGGELQSAISAVAANDLRGTRRWEAAESELSEMRSAMQGHRHDVRNVLNAVDGCLHLLASHRQSMSGLEVDRTLSAVRQEVQWLQMAFGDSADSSSYDLSELLRGIIDVHASGTERVLAEIEPELIARGRPERVALAVDNLLVNVAVHAPGSTAVLAARSLGEGGLVEISVSDEGSGLPDHELVLACERGWRGDESAGLPGSGLGLAQVRDLITAEGGEVYLEPTRDGATASTGPGLTVRLRLPLRPAT